MFNIGFTELIILAVIGIIVVGPEQLPDMARKLAKLLNELKRAKDEIMSPVEDMKNEALRSVEKMRTEAERIRAETEEQLNNQVAELMNANKKPEVEEATSEHLPTSSNPSPESEPTKKDEKNGHEG